MNTSVRLYRECGGLTNLIRLAEPALTAGMVKVARFGENWKDHPELTWQVWPADLEEMAMPSAKLIKKLR